MFYSYCLLFVPFSMLELKRQSEYLTFHEFGGS